MQQTTQTTTNESDVHRHVPGFFVAVVGGGLAMLLAQTAKPISTLLAAIAVGALIGNGKRSVEPLRPGLAFATKTPLRMGVVLLGLRVTAGQVLELGWPTIVLVITTVAATFFGTQTLGRLLGLPRGLSLLVATGYSICGASAIAAMEPSSDADEDEVAMAIGLVTVAGTAAMFGLPYLGDVFGLTDAQLGTWIGASVHDVAQVVGAASTGSGTVLSIAIVVKLTRIALLAPIVAGVAISRARRTGRDTDLAGAPLMPSFVVGFLMLVAMRSTGLVPDVVIELARTTETILFAVALVGLGSRVRVERLRHLGGPPLLLGFVAWLLVAGVSLIGALVVAP